MASHSTSLQEEQSRSGIDKHMGSVQSSVSVKTSDMRLINYSMQVSTNSGILLLPEKNSVVGQSQANNKENVHPNFKVHAKPAENPGTEKDQLYKKLWEENSLLKDLQLKKRDQLAMLKEKLARYSQGVEDANEVIKTKGNELLALKGAVEEAQRKNVGPPYLGFDD